MKSRKISCSGRTVSIGLAVVMAAGLLCGCAGGKTKNKSLNASETVSMTIAGPYSDMKAMESIIQDFNEIYPNCTINYEYLQDYRNSIATRLESEDGGIDIFLTDNIQSDSPLLPYAFDLCSEPDKLDLSQTFDGLTNNYKYLENTASAYSVPIGAEVRGMYVNKTLLESCGLNVPTNKTELLNACEVLSQKGFVPFQSNHGTFSQQLIFPYVTNIIAYAQEHDKVFADINSCSDSAAEYFREPMSFVYTLAEKKYYNYKYVENEYGFYTDSAPEACIQNFLNIVEKDNGMEKVDDVGIVAFMPGTISMMSQFNKMAEDYHSGISYEFTLAPVSDSGGFAYMSPARGIAVNKNSVNLDWALEFVNYFFNEDTNKKFAVEFNIIPNTKDAIQYLGKQFDVPENKITQPDDIAFDYGFYNVVLYPFIDASKSNNPKYMKDDGNGQYSMYELEYYMDILKESFRQQREGTEK